MVAKKEQDDAADWFYNKARSTSGYRKNITNNTERARDGVVIGKMFFFVYDPKTKDKLPVYDRFPLVFPIERYGDGFLGLNVHYLSQGERSTLLNRLMEYRSNQRMDERTRLRLTYDLISSTKKLASLTRPCIKRYLFSQVRSKFIEVTSNEWQQAINLPVQMFVVRN
jgi:hypothetical protein